MLTVVSYMSESDSLPTVSSQQVHGHARVDIYSVKEIQLARIAMFANKTYTGP